MNVDQNSARETVACSLCQSGPFTKADFVSHILGKSHQKKYKQLFANNSKALRRDKAKRTIYVTGYEKTTPKETIVGLFWKHRILNIAHCEQYSFVELAERHCVIFALSERHFIGDQRLKVSERHTNANTESSPLKLLSMEFKNRWRKPFESPVEEWNMISMLVNQIELKQPSYEKHEIIRQQIIQWFTPHFPSVLASVFGSSANNLGFEECDVDLYINLGVDPLAETSTEMDRKASRLNLIAKEIKRTRRGLKVKYRSRIQKIEFEDPRTNIHVNLNFNKDLAYYNTQLIRQYTSINMLVRPYLMVIKLWAKIQEVAGGGGPKYRITNYAFTMMMLFYLMVRHHQVIPSVALLQSQRPIDYSEQQSTGGWDCSCGQDEWSNRRHSETVMKLVQEFFSYYGNFDAKKWVISPLSGQLLDKESVKQRIFLKLPQCMQEYCQQDTDIQIDTPLCVQDPLKHSLNITSCLQEGPLAEFQYKCKKASEISEDIVRGRKPLEALFEEISMDKGVLNEVEELLEKQDIQEINTGESSLSSTSDVSVIRKDNLKRGSNRHVKNNDQKYMLTKLILDGQEVELSDEELDEFLMNPKRK